MVDTGITIASGVNTIGSAGTYDVVFVATEHDSLYAIDTNPLDNGAVLWKRSFIDITNSGGNINNTLGATAITTVPNGDTGSEDINPEVGITGTPVIDRNTNTMYVVVKTKVTIGGADHYVQCLHAINIADGTDRVTPFLIGDTTNGNTNNTPIYVNGSGDGNVGGVVQFNALREAERGALSLVNNTVYVEWASHGDNGPYHGWVATWNVANLSATGFVLSGVLNTSPNDGLAGIWQGGGRLVFEPNGSAFYFETGNGSGGAPTLNGSGFPSNANYNEALVKVVADPSSTATNQNPNGWGMKVADYFIPYNVSALDGADSDFGSGAPLLLPDSAGIPGHPHLMVAAGKEGKIYVIDRDSMGHYSPTNDNVLNTVPNGSGNNTPPVQLGGSLSTPAYYNGKIYWVSGYSSYAYAYTINSNGTLSVTSQTANNNFGYLPGSIDVSANGTNNGIVWVMDLNANKLHAYDAATLATELWNSGQKAGGVDNLGAGIKFAVPTVANGEVFVGTSSGLVVYGLPLPPTAVPGQPTLSATPLSGSSINLTWTDTTAPPNMATSYFIEDSTDGTTFSVVTTSPAGSTSLAIGGLQPLTKYYFRIRGVNNLGYSPYSAVVSATTTNSVAVLDFSGGFVGSQSKLTFNGTTALNGSKLELTNGGGGEAASAFSTTPVDVTRFSTQFTFQVTPSGGGTADGFTFCIQGTGAKSLGPAGGGLGYGPDNTGGTPGIGSSVAIKFDLYSNQGEGIDSTGLYTNGVAPTNIGSIDLTGTGIDLHSGDVMNVTMYYDGTTLTVTINDTVTGKSTTQNYMINIPSSVGGSTAYVGFTGGTGGLTATQDILTWTYSPIAVSPNAPSGLGGSPASATSISLNWTNNATNQTGFHLDRASDQNFTQNLITETLPAMPNTFTDTVAGLAPGSTFYYRLRAFNTAGDSGNSNPVGVTIPLAPPKPTNQQVTNVTTTEIDMSWQDNAGHQADGYHILRAVNHGSFTQVAALPLTSRTPPSTYTWADTNLTPGFFYEYHIIAYNVSGNNDFAGVNATTLTLAPSGLNASSGSNAVDLSWTSPSGAVSYNVYRSTVSGGESGHLLASGVSTTNYADNTALAGTTYYYMVTALNANAAPLPAESALSTEASAVGVINPIVTTITVNPLSVNLTAGAPEPFTAVVKDQFGNPMGTYPPLTWSLTTGGGSINSSTGLYTAPYAGGTATVTAAIGSVTGTATANYSGLAEWNSSVGNSWGSANWKDATLGTSISVPGVRNLVGDTVLFGSSGGSPVTLDGASPSVAEITFDNSGVSYTLSKGSGGTLHLENHDDKDARITVSAGNHTINAPLMLDSNLVIAPQQASTSLTISDMISGAGKSLSVNGLGTVTLSGTNSSYSGGTIVTSGKLVVASAGALLSGSSLFVGSDATTVFGGSVASAAAAVVAPASAAGNIPSASFVSAAIGPAAAAEMKAVPSVLPLLSAAPAFASHALLEPQESPAKLLPLKTATAKATVAAVGRSQTNPTKARDTVLQSFVTRQSIDLAWLALNNEVDALHRSQQESGPLALTVDQVLARFGR